MLIGKDVLIADLVTAYQKDCQGTNRADAASLYQVLLSELSDHEIRRLREDPDLIERVRQIANYQTAGLMSILQSDFQLSFQHLYGECFVDFEKVAQSIPDWVHVDHGGWEFTALDVNFNLWARKFLLQEVRVNLWIRFFEEQKKRIQSAKKVADLAAPGYL